MDESVGVLQVRRRVRPIRVGFDLDINDSRVVGEAIETATTQWGGMLFPLLPNFARRPRWWQDYIRPQPSAVDIREGYAATFDTDYRISLPPPTDEARTFRSIRFDDLTSEADEWSQIPSGLPVTAVYRHLWERDPRFLEREAGTAITVTAADPQMELFAAACFGAFPADGDLAEMADQYRRTFEPVERELTPRLMLDGVRPTARSSRCFGPLQIASYGLRFRGDPITGGTILMLLDPRRVSDVVDFWNLRALGRHVVPIPLDSAEELVPELVERLAAPEAQKWRGHDEVIGSQRVADDDVAAFVASLNDRGMDVFRSRFPMLWRRADPTTAKWSVIAEEDETEVAIRDGRLRVGLLAPPAGEYYPGGTARWISTVELVPWGLPGDGSVASMLPTALDEVAQLVGTFTHYDVRATGEGLAMPSGILTDEFDWVPPSGREVLSELLGSAGIGPPTPSQPGLVAEELIRRLGGLSALGLIRDRELIDLFERAAVADIELESNEDRPRRRRPRTGLIPRGTLEGHLSRRHKNDPDRAQSHLRALVDRGVLTSGPRLNCPHCTHRNWYPVRELDDEITCERCLRTYPFPHAQPPERADWAYRPIGAFSFPDYAAGSYTVAFALSFLTQFSRERNIWSTSLGFGKDFEIDFAVLRESRERLTEGEPPVLLLGEAKTNGRFEPKDFRRLRRLQRRFPEAILVVATLRSKLSAPERKALKEIAQPNVKRLSQVIWTPSVMVLTDAELLSGRDAPDCWTRLGGTAEEIAAKSATISNNPEVRRIADLSAQIHLGLPPQHVWAQRTVERLARHRKRNR